MTTAETALIPVTDWLRDIYATPDLAQKVADYIAAAAREAAPMCRHNVGAFILEPGDSTRYDLIIARVPDDRNGIRAVDALGGDVLVALPSRGMSMLINLGATWHLPYYVAEKMGTAGTINPITATVVAAFLTLLDANLADLQAA
jgi:hypothetical protein